MKLNARNFVIDNLVVIIFLSFTVLGFILSGGVPLFFFLNELIDRVFRNSFLVLSLIIPVIAGLGLNFGIVVGAMAGQAAIIFVRYHEMGGFGALMLCFLLSFPLALLFGYLTGKLYNRVRGQEMIASLIVGFFAQGIYNFVFLYAVGGIIPVTQGNPIIIDKIGVRVSVDLGAHEDGGLKYALDFIYRVPPIYLLLAGAITLLVFIFIRKHIYRRKKVHDTTSRLRFWIYFAVSIIAIIFSIAAIFAGSSFAGCDCMRGRFPCYINSLHNSPLIIWLSELMRLRQAPLVTVLVIAALCFFMHILMKTKLGQDFRSVGQSQHIAEVSGINVDRTRIIATIFSTVLAAWGMIIFMQNFGTLATYDSHRNIGIFSVAALLVGGASTSRASLKNAIIGVLLFNSMTIISPELGRAVFGSPEAGEFFRSFMVYGVIGLALGIYVWKQHKAAKDKNTL